MSTSRSATALATCAALATGSALLVLVPPAQAAPPVVDERYAGTFSQRAEECGYDLLFEGTYSGTFQERLAPDGALLLGKDRYSVEQTITNLGTGGSFSTGATGMFRQQRPVPLGGDLYEVTSVDTGAHFTVYDGDGRAVQRNRGRVELRFVLDTLGDGDPATFDVVELEMVDTKGPFVEGGDFCTDVLAYTT